jgi:hypothetical protein
LNTGGPRSWFLPGRRIEVNQAATFFGEMSFRIDSHPDQGFIAASVSLPTRERPREVYLRLRHPGGKPIIRMELNGQEWTKFSTTKEWVSLPSSPDRIEVKAFF